VDFSGEPIPAQTDPRDSRDAADYTEDERQDGKGRGKKTKRCKERDGLGAFCDSPEIIDGFRATEVGNESPLLRQNGKRQKDTPISEEASEEERRAEGVAGRIVDGEC
jgi:hypothetical protein